LSTVCLSMYSITENIYYSQLSSVAILLQPEPTFTSCNTMKGLCSLSLCAIVLQSSPPSHVSTCNGQRSSQLFCVHYTPGFGHDPTKGLYELRRPFPSTKCSSPVGSQPTLSLHHSAPSHPTRIPLTAQSKAAKITNKYVFILMMETAMFAETLDNF
jgi:hypothetical protein